MGMSIFDVQNNFIFEQNSNEGSQKYFNNNIDSSNKNEIIKAGAASKKLPKVGNLSGKTGLTKLQKYMNRNLNHRSGGSHSASGVAKTRRGDCWGLAEWAAKELRYNNYKVRIVQGASSAASNHRWVQTKISGKWINFESSLVTKRYGSKHYSKTCARPNKVIKYL